MIQTHNQLISISKEYNSLFSKNEFYPLQKAYTTPHFIVLSVRFPGKTVALYIGRGNQYQGLYLSVAPPPSFLRVQDKLLDYVRKYLVGARIGKVEIDTRKMLMKFTFKNDHTDNSFIFGYKDRQLFFAKQSKEEIYLSWNGASLIGDAIDVHLAQLSPDNLVSLEMDKNWSILEYLKEEEKKVSGQPIQKKKEKFLSRKISNITNDLREVSQWKSLESDLKEDLIDLSNDELKWQNQKIKFHGMESIWQKRDLVFKKIKKLKKAEEILSNRLREAQVEIENVKVGNFEFEITKEKIIQPLWMTNAKRQKQEPSMTGYNFKNFSIRHIQGVIALDAASNDHIRSQANKEHYWLHVENHAGSHCILKIENLSLLTIEQMSAIASMIRDFSRLEILEIPILYSQLKNIKGVKGAKGEVIVKKPKHLRCSYIQWKEIITIA